MERIEAEHPRPRHFLLHLSDPHLLGGPQPLHGVVDSEALLRQLFEEVHASGARPEAVIFTGDLADLGEPEAYAKLRAIVEGFLGRSLADGEEYDLALMIGKPCVVNLKDGVSGAGKKFVEVSSIGKPMKGQIIPEQTRESFAFSLSQVNSVKDDLGIPGWVPPNYGRKIEDEIKKSKEWDKLGDVPPF